MQILYIFPHPDDESFGPASAISAQLRAGHQVHLLTLTRGGATKQRFNLGLTVDEMGEVRLAEMEAMAKVLGLSSLTVWDFPDSGLIDVQDQALEKAIEEFLWKLRPEIVVTYAAHGVSGFQDHLVAHNVVKAAFISARAKGADFLRRLAFFTISESQIKQIEKPLFNLNYTPDESIDCIVSVSDADAMQMERALDCYATYQQTITHSGVRCFAKNDVSFEFFEESYTPALRDLTARL